MTDGRLRFGMFLPPYHARHENLRWRCIAISGWSSISTGSVTTRSGSASIIPQPSKPSARPRCSSPPRRADEAHSPRTGVVSLGYHHPFMVAERINYLDPITRGRVMFGVGPGALPSDGAMLGIAPRNFARAWKRSRCSHPAASGRSGQCRGPTGSKLRNARLQMLPYTRPRIEMAVTSMGSTSGAIAAGRYGMGILQFQSIGLYPMTTLPDIWALVQQTAKENNQSVDRSKWRLVLQMHIAESRDQAIPGLSVRLCPLGEYFPPHQQPTSAAPEGYRRRAGQAFVDAGTAVIGTPDDAITAIERHLADTGRFRLRHAALAHWASSARRPKATNSSRAM
jgi:limonene 1,2-monooxygenase